MAGGRGGVVSEARPLDSLQADDLRLHLGSRFSLRLAAGQTLELALVEVSEHAHPPGVARRRQGFSLVFRSELPGHLPQAIYRLEHEAMGTMDVFLVPIGPRDGGMCYEAIFN
jgi:uncharacterized protein DUF6916